MEVAAMRTHTRAMLGAMCGSMLLTLLVVPGVIGQTKAVPTEELAQRAEVVAVGKVTAMKAEWDQTKTRIVTRVTMAVGEYLKGSAGNVMTIISPGGEVDGVGEWYSHTARFQKDEDVVVFAEKDKKGDYRVAGGQEGKISIKKDEATGMALVSEQTTLDDFKAQIRNALNVQQSK